MAGTKKPKKTRKTPGTIRLRGPSGDLEEYATGWLLSGFTAMDALMAPAAIPFPPEKFAKQVSEARAALDRLRTGGSARDWSIVCFAANHCEVMILQGVLADPDGLLSDVMRALADLIVPTARAGSVITVPPGQADDLEDLIDAWEHHLQTTPQRVIVRSMREVERRAREIAQGRASARDLVVVRTDYA